MPGLSSNFVLGFFASMSLLAGCGGQSAPALSFQSSNLPPDLVFSVSDDIVFNGENFHG